MEDLQLRHRSRMRHNYTMTSNVLLMGYGELSDGAKITYQVIDSYDWSNGEGSRKGFAYPSLQTLADLRGIEKRSARRHIAELERCGLLTREQRAGQPNMLVIEDISSEEEKKYLQRLEKRGEDKIVRPTPDKIVRPIYKKDEREEDKTVNEDKPLRTVTEPESLQAILNRRTSKLRQRTVQHHNKLNQKREYLARQMVAVLGDLHSLGFYRKVGANVHPQAIFEALGEVKEIAASSTEVRSKGALFVRLLEQKQGWR